MSDLVLYNYFRSSTSYRARIALHLKNLKFDYKSVHLLNNGGEQHKAEYRKLNPAEEVPTLIHGDKVIGQSMAIIQYLDEVFPQSPLFPKDAYAKAKVLQICENINCGHSLQNLKVTQYLEENLGFSTEEKEDWLHEWVGRILLSTEKIIAANSGKYAFGNEITAADAFIIPQLFSAERFKMDIGVYPNLTKVKNACLVNEAFKKAHPLNQVDTPSELKK